MAANKLTPAAFWAYLQLFRDGDKFVAVSSSAQNVRELNKEYGLESGQNRILPYFARIGIAQQMNNTSGSYYVLTQFGTDLYTLYRLLREADRDKRLGTLIDEVMNVEPWDKKDE